VFWNYKHVIYQDWNRVWLILTGPAQQVLPHIFAWRWKQIQFLKYCVYFFVFLKHCVMDEVQKLKSFSECYIIVCQLSVFLPSTCCYFFFFPYFLLPFFLPFLPINVERLVFTFSYTRGKTPLEIHFISI